MEVGYNLVTRRAMEEGKYESIKERPISIIEFLRRVRRKTLPKETTIFGFESLFYYCNKEERRDLTIYVRKLLRKNAELVIQNGNVFQFIIEGDLSKNKDFVLRYEKMRLHLNWIFGNRIDTENALLDWLYVAPNI
ncbi:MAG: hypothetical protein ACTSR0_01605 [Candidatus Asgardarchaeia archaeon]